jgi:hypothetical protein
METIDNDVKITINLTDLVKIRAKFLDSSTEYVDIVLSDNDVDEVASYLRKCLTWDTLYGMVDDSILEHLDKLEIHYGEISSEEPAKSYEEQRKNAAKFEMVDLVSPAWTIQVPRRIK